MKKREKNSKAPAETDPILDAMNHASMPEFIKDGKIVKRSAPPATYRNELTETSAKKFLEIADNFID